ncbi:MAG: DUF4065 domain-containing protein [Clostridiales bacterium]|jgi:uncharacterized phage-associated protein|nr:DUF4065 domain-containing protein [Clostridiales bacterium]
MQAVTLAQWFLQKNPSLCNGYNDENTKLNKLLYFANLMHHAVTGEDLIDERFEKWINGPVLRSVYRDYRYNGLGCVSLASVPVDDPAARKMLEIVNFVYGNKSGRELSDETHTHSIWQEQEPNGLINFANMSVTERNLMRNLYETYRHLDFDKIGTEKINGNLYYFDKNELEVSEKMISELEQIPPGQEPVFLQMIDGDLIFS